MPIFKPTKIQTKFFSGLLLAIVIIGGLFSGGFYLHMRNLLEEEVRDKANLIFLHVDSIQHYVRDILRPTMYDRLPSGFVIEAMSSSYVSRQIMAPVNDTRDGTIYRRVAVDARNPAYEANKYEFELIQYFRENEGIDLWQGYRKMKGTNYYLMVRPVRFEKSCMHCHGSPEDAPEELIELYGNKGFGKESGAIAGVDFVGISVPSSVGRVENTILMYFVVFAFGTLLFFSVTNVLFKVLVVNNLRRLNTVFRRNVSDEKGVALLQRIEQGDEIEELVEGMERMSEHLLEARTQLQDYAENLRRMVDERTVALSSEVRARREDVHLFVSLLGDMRKSSSRSELWRAALPQICGRFAAHHITYICTMGPQNFFVWPEGDGQVDRPDNFVEIVTGSTCVRKGSRIFVPVESSSGNAEGVLCLYWKTEEEAARHDGDVLQALGRQLGTVAENLTSIDSLIRQMNVLETIFEGITDPLALMDTRCNALTANQAAKRLAKELTSGKRTDGNILKIFFDLGAVEEDTILEVIGSGSPVQRQITLSPARSFSLSLYPVCGRIGKVDQLILYIHETTEEKRILVQALHSEKMATVGKLTAGLAHEINNPLGVILCYTGLLSKSINNGQQAMDLQVIERHTRQAQHVLQKLLNFARPKAAGTGTADAAAVVTSVIDVFSVQAGKKGVQLQLQCPRKQLQVQMGVNDLEQVISNLIINALDAVAEQQGAIHVQVADGEDTVSVIIEDNGPGIGADDAHHIFTPFFSTKEVGEGTGLGLAIVYAMVTDVGGLVEAGQSSVLGGARFRVSLPRAGE